MAKQLTKEELASKFNITKETEPDYKAYLELPPKTYGIRFRTSEGEQRLMEIWAPNETEAKKVFMRMGPKFKGELDVLDEEQLKEIYGNDEE